MRVTHRTDVVTASLSVWFVLGLFLDAWAHANVPELESFFTPWHAVFYSGFTATGGWILWVVWRNARRGLRGRAAIPEGYGLTVPAMLVFALSGVADLLWHTIFGIETTVNIFFSPSHLGLITSMIIILTSPLRSAWSNPVTRKLGPSVVTISFATTLVLLFLEYGNAILWGPYSIILGFSQYRGADVTASQLAATMVITNIVLLVPLLVIARRWHVPFGAATLLYTLCSTISGALTGYANLPTLFSIAGAGVLVDLLARWLNPTADRRTAFWAFGALAALITWTVYMAVAISWIGQFPLIPELWTGAPIVQALLGGLLSVLLLPTDRHVEHSRYLRARQDDQHPQPSTTPQPPPTPEQNPAPA